MNINHFYTPWKLQKTKGFLTLLAIFWQNCVKMGRNLNDLKCTGINRGASQRYIKDSVKHMMNLFCKNSLLLLAVNLFRKKAPL